MAARGRRSSPAYALIVYGLAVLVGTGTVPVGLWQSYAEAFHFSDAVLTVLAASTTIGVIVAVIAFGPISDVMGRRPVLVYGLVLGAVSLVTLLLAEGVPALLAGRILSGFAIGIYTGAATAALTELVADGNTRRAATHAATASIVGFAVGPLVGGLFVEYGAWPLRLVYVVSLVALVPAFLAVVVMKETVANPSRFRPRIERLGVPHPGARTFALASLIALCAFMQTSFFQSLGPTIVLTQLDVENHALAAAIAVCFLGTSCVAQIGFRGLPIRRQTVLGLTLLPIGSALLALALLEENLPVFVLGALIGGFGQGLAYLGGQSLVERVTPPGQRGETFSAYLVVVYVSGGGTAILLGLAANAVGLHPAAIAYASIVCVMSVATAILCANAIQVRATRKAETMAPAA